MSLNSSSMDSHTSRASEIRGGADEPNELLQRLKIGFYFGLWYFLNVVYNSEFRQVFFLVYSIVYHHCSMLLFHI